MTTKRNEKLRLNPKDYARYKGRTWVVYAVQSVGKKIVQVTLDHFGDSSETVYSVKNTARVRKATDKQRRAYLKSLRVK